MGSSYLPGELIAAFLHAQLVEAENITAKRRKLWNLYQTLTADLEEEGLLRRPVIPAFASHNAHMYFILIPEDVDRSSIIDNLKQTGIQTVSHYEPLHESKAGRHFGTTQGHKLINTEKLAKRVLRLPLWAAMPESAVHYVAENLGQILRETAKKASP